MGSSDELNLPDAPASSTINDLYGGQEQYGFFKGLRDSGLPPELKTALTNKLTSQLSGNTRAGVQRINEMSGNSTLSGRLGAIGNIYQGNAGAMSDFTNNLAGQDYQARLGGASGIGSIWGALNTRDLANLQRFALQSQNELSRYKIDEESGFNWGSLGGLLGSGLFDVLSGMATGGTGLFKK